MKKKVLIGTIAAGIIFGGAVAVGAMDKDDNNPTNKTAEVANAKTMLSVEEAEKIALQEVDGVLESIELERESGREVYDVDVDKNDDDYDIHIDAYTGEVYSVGRDDDDDDDKEYQEIDSNSSNSNLISQDEAVTIAEKKVNGTMVEIDLDEDDGYRLYEVELKTDKGKAEVDIDASNGNILKVEWDD